MSTIKSKKVQLGTDANAANNFTLYQPSTPDGTLRIGVGNADNPTEVGQFNANGYKPQSPVAFSVALSSDQAISSGVYTKVAFDSVKFDTDSYWDAANYRYTPQVAGYYQFHTTVRNRTNTTMNDAMGGFFKNGVEYNRLSGPQGHTVGIIFGCAGSMVVYLNGTTDYIEVYSFNSGGTNNRFGGDAGLVVTVFSGILIQQA